MKAAAFAYERADSLDQALDRLAALQGRARLLAGGQSLVPTLNLRLQAPEIVLDISRLKDLRGIAIVGQSIRIGALTRHNDLLTSDLIGLSCPLLRMAATHIAHPAIRNRGTIGGSLSHADPAAELPMMSVLLDAELTIRSHRGARVEKARDFFTSALTTSLTPDEMLCEVAFPVPAAGTRWGFEEIARRDGDFALAAVAVMLRIDSGVIRSPRIAVMGVHATPLRVVAAEQVLDGQTPGEAVFMAAADAVRAAVEPNDDQHGSADYRRHLAGVITRRALAAAVSREI